MYEDAPDDHIFDLYEAAVYPDHPLGRPDHRHARVGAVVHARRRWSATSTATTSPDRMVVSAAGDVSPRRDRRAGPRSSSPASTARRQPPSAAPPRPTRRSRLVLDRPRCSRRTSSSRHAALRRARPAADDALGAQHHPGRRHVEPAQPEHPREVRLVLLRLLVRQRPERLGRRRRLHRRRTRRAWTAPRVLIVRETARSWPRPPVSARMLERAKQQLKGSIVLGLESTSTRMQRLGRVELTYGQDVTIDEVVAEIDAVTADDVRAVAEELFAPERMSTVAILPRRRASSRYCARIPGTARLAERRPPDRTPRHPPPTHGIPVCWPQGPRHRRRRVHRLARRRRAPGRGLRGPRHGRPLGRTSRTCREGRRLHALDIRSDAAADLVAGAPLRRDRATSRPRWTCAARWPTRASTPSVNVLGFLNLMEAGRAARPREGRLRLDRRRDLRRARPRGQRRRPAAGEPPDAPALAVRHHQAGLASTTSASTSRRTASRTPRSGSATSTVRARTPTARPAWSPSSRSGCCAASRSASTARARRRATTCSSATSCARSWPRWRPTSRACSTSARASRRT